MNKLLLGLVTALILSSSVFILSADDSEALPSVETDIVTSVGMDATFNVPQYSTFTLYVPTSSEFVSYKVNAMGGGGVFGDVPSEDAPVQWVPEDRCLYGMVIYPTPFEVTVTTSDGPFRVTFTASDSIRHIVDYSVLDIVVYEGQYVVFGNDMLMNFGFNMTFPSEVFKGDSALAYGVNLPPVGDYDFMYMDMESGIFDIFTISVIPAPEWSPLWVPSDIEGPDDSDDPDGSDDSDGSSKYAFEDLILCAFVLIVVFVISGILIASLICRFRGSRRG